MRYSLTKFAAPLLAALAVGAFMLSKPFSPGQPPSASAEVPLSPAPIDAAQPRAWQSATFALG